MRNALVTLLFFSAATAGASNFVMGTMPDQGTISFSTGGPINIITFIDVSHPATASANVSNVSVRWSRTSCTNAFKVKFVRPASTFGNYTLLAERGPFTVTASVTNVAISPAVSVQSGDLIAVTQLQPVTCGGVMATKDDPSSVMLQVSSDIQSGSFTATSPLHGLTLNARATTSANEPAGILTAVGAVQGVGSFFRTAVQLANNGASSMTGNFVYHPQGQSASPSDPTISYSIAPFGTWSQNDILTAMGLSGLGSMDLVTTTGGTPRVVARVFNDRGTDGTDGFVEPLIKPEDAMPTDASDIIILPSDLTAFRINVGVRTLNDGATLSLYYTNASDVFVSAPDKVYPPNSFTQQPLSLLLSGSTSYVANKLAGVQIKAGSAIIYVSIIDNKTGDSSVYFLGRQ